MYVHIEPSWKELLDTESSKEYFQELSNRVSTAYNAPDTNIFPSQKSMFNAFAHCPFNDVKVVILGQDPYHAQGQAHGLSFSVVEGVPTPPSLRNIYTEIQNDIGSNPALSGNLERWADQGVLLLNSTLTVEEGRPGSHQKFGWETFTDAVIQKISNEKHHVVFLLWGKHAQEKGTDIDTSKHLVLTAPHPSPLSAYRGFLGCKHFSQTNQYLQKHRIQTINW
jgi:uracil-DNA glycosylase